MPMSLERSASRLPAVLIASGQDWVARSLESILLPHSMDVFTVLSGQQALEYVRSRPTDAVVLDTALPDTSTLELCRIMRDSSMLEAQTPS
jgi:DNA-binding response OmpR family regulator